MQGQQQIAWTGTIARLESEPETQEGRRELMRRATDAEKKRDTALAKDHHFEMASAAFQIAIVIVSASVITGVALLAIGGQFKRFCRSHFHWPRNLCTARNSRFLTLRPPRMRGSSSAVHVGPTVASIQARRIRRRR